MNQYQLGVGLYQTACESSPNRQQINIWLNEEKSNIWISKELNRVYGEKISDKSISKYRKYYEEEVQRQLEATPEYQAKIQVMNDEFNMSLGKVKSVDVLAKLTDLISDSADLLAHAKEDDIKINDIKEMRMVQQTMIDAIKIYGDTVLKAQKLEEINKNPDLLRPTTVNVNIKSALTDILRGVMGNGESNFDIIDRLRNSRSGESDIIIDAGGISGDTCDTGSDIVDGE